MKNELTPNQLLDLVKQGANFTHEQITRALIATGDIATHGRVRSARLVAPLRNEATSPWDERRPVLVVQRNRRLGADQGQADDRQTTAIDQ